MRAVEQMRERRANAVAGYIGFDAESALELAELEFGRRLLELGSGGEAATTFEELERLQVEVGRVLGFLAGCERRRVRWRRYRSAARERLYFPDLQRGVMVVGAPGSGKTFSTIDPLLRSVIEQGFPVILYDFKYPSQAAILGPYAERLGYEVRVFAPGFPESETVNVLDFMRDCLDAETAGQIAHVMNKNFQVGTDKDDPFFSTAATQLLQAVFMVAKASPEPDLVMAQVVISLSNLVERLERWRERREIDDVAALSAVKPEWGAYAISEFNKSWILRAFAQIISVGKSEKTLSSIVGVATNNLTQFMKPNIAPHFVGRSTFDFWLEGRQLLIVGMDRVRRDSVGPLVATALHMLTQYNLTLKKRRDPLVVALDELPTIYLPQIQNWLNENRSDGFCGIIGFQNMTQLEKAYGKELARSIMTGCNTKFIFNPGETESAEFFARALGEEEVRSWSRSRSRGKGGSSTSISEQDKPRKLFDPAQFLKLDTGMCVVVSPGYKKAVRGGRQEAFVPMLKRIRISKAEIEFCRMMEQRWAGFVARRRRGERLELDLQSRTRFAETLLRY